MIIVMMKKKTLIFITREAFLGNQPHISTTFADFPLCFWAPLQDISRVFGTFLLRYPTSKFDHFRRIRDARAAAADSKTTMISWFIKSSSSSSPLRTGTGKRFFEPFLCGKRVETCCYVMMRVKSGFTKRKSDHLNKIETLNEMG